MNSTLGKQGIHIIREAARTSRDIEQAVRRQRIEEVSIRPVPGTSDLLGWSMNAHVAVGVDNRGRMRAVDVYNLVGMAPIHLKR